MHSVVRPRSTSLGRRAILLGGAALGAAGLAGVLSAEASAAGLPFRKISRDGDRLMEILDAAPYVREGHGPVAYVLVSQTCPFCAALWRDHREAEKRIEFRWLPLPYTQDDRDQIAQVIKSRSVDDFRLYMARSLRAAPLQEDSAKVRLYNELIRDATIARNIIRENGCQFGTPVWLWRRDEGTEYFGGYSREQLPAIMRRLAA